MTKTVSEGHLVRGRLMAYSVTQLVVASCFSLIMRMKSSEGRRACGCSQLNGQEESDEFEGFAFVTTQQQQQQI